MRKYTLANWSLIPSCSHPFLLQFKTSTLAGGEVLGGTVLQGPHKRPWDHPHTTKQQTPFVTREHLIPTPGTVCFQNFPKITEMGAEYT